MNANTNARFWVRWNRDWVKLTLTPGQTVTMHARESDADGWAHSHLAYRHAGEVVALSIVIETLDCDDGRYDEFRELTCPLDALKANSETDDADEERPPLPGWNLDKQTCLDHPQ